MSTLNSTQTNPSSAKSKWPQVVLSGESELIASAAPPVSVIVEKEAAVEKETMGENKSEKINESGGNAVSKPVWKKPSNGTLEGSSVMGADAWPALTEKPRVSMKSDSVKGAPGGSSSVSVTQGTEGVSSSSSSDKQVSTNTNSNSTSNHRAPAPQRSMNHITTNTASNAGTLQPQGSHGQVGEIPPNNPSPREFSQRNLHPRAGDDQAPHQRNSIRNRNNGSYHHGYGGRRDQDRTNQDWNYHRNGRDGHIQAGRRPFRHLPSPPSPMPFVPSAAMRPFPTYMFPEVGASFYYYGPPPESIRGVPFAAGPMSPPPAIFYPPSDPDLHFRIRRQIDYYFSDENLIGDAYLKQNMDGQGWVPIKLIAGFNRIAQLTDNISLILEALRSSIIVEVQDDKVRRRNDWSKWILRPSEPYSNTSSFRPRGNSNQEMLTEGIQQLSLSDSITNPTSARSQPDNHAGVLVGNLSSQFELPRVGEIGQMTMQGGINQTSVRSSSG